MANGTVYVGSEDGNLYALDAGIDGSSTGSRVQLGTYGHHGEWQYADQSISRGTVDAEKESEGGPSAVAPGFSVGGTLTALGGVGYLLKRRLADSEND